MEWVKAAIQAIPEAQEPDSNSRRMMQSKLFWLSDIRTKLDGELGHHRHMDPSTAAQQQPRFRKANDGGPCSLLYRSEKLGWLPVLAVERYPTVCRNFIRTTDESVWLPGSNSSCLAATPVPRDGSGGRAAAQFSLVQKGRSLGKYLSTKYHLNAGLMEKFYLWIEEHLEQIEMEEKLERQRKFWREQAVAAEANDEAETPTGTTWPANGGGDGEGPSCRHYHRVTPSHRSCTSPIRSLMDADDSFGPDEDDHNKDDEGMGWEQRRRSVEAMDQRVRQLEDQNYVLTTRVSALECRNIALEHQLLTMIQALKDANLLP
jgi:hypothetical protein